MSRPLYNGQEMNHTLVEAAIEAGLVERHATGLRSKMTRILGEQYASAYSRAMKGFKTLRDLGRWCDILGVRFIWSEGQVQFVKPTDAFAFVDGEGVIVPEEGEPVLITENGQVIRIVDPVVLERLGLAGRRTRGPSADPIDFGNADHY